MGCQRVNTGHRLLTSGEVCDSDDAGVRCRPKDRELAKVLVKRHQSSLLPVRQREDRFVAWIRHPLAGPDNVVTGVD